MTMEIESPPTTATEPAAGLLSPAWTGPYVRCLETAAALAEARDIGVIYGPSGCGKSYSARAASAQVAASGVAVIWLDMPPRPSPKAVTVRLSRAVSGECDHRQPEYVLTDELVERLAIDQRLVVIDEAQNLDTNGLNQLRYLHDRPDANWGLLLAGTHALDHVVRAAPELTTRVARSVEFGPLSGDALYRALAQAHSMFGATAEALIDEIDELFAHGVFRLWARLANASLALWERGGRCGHPPKLNRRPAKAAMYEVSRM